MKLTLMFSTLLESRNVNSNRLKHSIKRLLNRDAKSRSKQISNQLLDICQRKHNDGQNSTI